MIAAVQKKNDKKKCGLLLHYIMKRQHGIEPVSFKEVLAACFIGHVYVHETQEKKIPKTRWFTYIIRLLSGYSCQHPRKNKCKKARNLDD